MKAFLIARVSTEDQEEALPGQVYRLEEYAKRNNYDYELFEFQESAFKDNRKKFSSIVDKIEQYKEKSIVVFDKIDRYSRDISSSETKRLRKLCESGRIEIHFPSDTLVVTQKSSAQVWFMLGMGEVNAEYYSRSVGDNVVRRFEQLWRDGIWTHKAPFGYKNVIRPDRSNWIEINSFEAECVKTVFKLYASGLYSIRQIRKQIIDEYGLVKASSQWHKILNNPFYCGTMIIKGDKYKHQYETIISEQLFEKTKKVFEDYKIAPCNKKGKPYPYRGLITCHECGCIITYEKQKRKYDYLHCTKSKGNHGVHVVLMETVTKQFKAIFKEIQLPEIGYQQIIESYNKDQQEDTKQKQQKMNEVIAQIKRYEDMIDKNYDAYLEGKVMEEKYTKKHEDLSKAKQTLENTRNSFELMSKDNSETIYYLLDVAKRAPEIFENSDDDGKREIINLVLSNLELDQELLRYQIKKPYDLMAICNKTQNWLPIVDEFRNFTVLTSTRLLFG